MLILMIATLWIVWKLCMLGVRMAWGLTKFALSVVIFPAIVVGLVLAGLVYLAVPVLIVAGIIALLGGTAAA